jgi:hypothetical protein
MGRKGQNVQAQNVGPSKLSPGQSPELFFSSLSPLRRLSPSRNHVTQCGDVSLR